MVKNHLTLAVAALIAICAPAHGTEFVFTYVFSDFSCPACYVSASGTLTTTEYDLITNSYLVLSISGTRRSEAGVEETITGLISPGGYAGNDNLLRGDPGQWLTYSGLSFSIANLSGGNDGFGNVNVFFDGLGYLENGANTGYGSFTVSPHAVPEPGTGLILILALAGCALRKVSYT